MARTLALWCADWPAIAAAAANGRSPIDPVAVTSAGRVIASTATARQAGVRRGLRKREASARCPELHIVVSDPTREAALFEPVTAAIDTVAPGLEILRPGLVALPARGMVTFFGGQENAAQKIVDAVSAVGVESQAGIADQLSTSVIAAKHAWFIPPGEDARYLAELSITELAAEPALATAERIELIDLLHRLGIRRIGQFADLDRADVASRFGPDALVAHRLARGEPERPTSGRALPPELVTELDCDPPIERVDAAAFAGRGLATALHSKLAAAGLSCLRLRVSAVTAHGEERSRVWRCAEPLTPDGTADRIRWQLDGWLTGKSASSPSAPIVTLILEPVEVISSGALQLGLWGGMGDDDERAHRALVRVQGVLGIEAVHVPVLSGGRTPAERLTLIPLGDELRPALNPDAPWPGTLPGPPPAVLPSAAVAVFDSSGAPVMLDGRGAFTSRPASLRWGSTAWELSWWSSPWLLDERWWDSSSRMCAQVQVILASSRALLLRYENETWCAEGIYE